MQQLRYAYRISAVLLWLVFAVGVSNGKSKTDFPKGLMFSPGDLREHFLQADRWGCQTESQRRAQLRAQFFETGAGYEGMRAAYAEMDSLNLNWYYQCHLTQEDIMGLQRPDLRFSTTALPERMGQWLEASRCYMNVGWEDPNQAQSVSIEHGTRTLWAGSATGLNNVAFLRSDLSNLPSGFTNYLKVDDDSNETGWIFRPGAREEYVNLVDKNIRSYVRGGGTTSTNHRWTAGNFDWWHEQPEGRTGFSFIPLCRIHDADTTESDTVAAIVVCMASHTGKSTLPPDTIHTPEQIEEWVYPYLASIDHDSRHAMDFGLMYITTDMFHTPGEWEKIVLQETLKFWWPVGTDFVLGLYWYGSVDFDIAALDIRDEYYDTLFDSLGQPTDSMDKFVSTLNSFTQGMPGGLLQSDEPMWGQYHVLRYLNDHVPGGSITMNDEHGDDTLTIWGMDSTGCKHLSNDQFAPSGAWARHRASGQKVVGYDPSGDDYWPAAGEPNVSYSSILPTTNGLSNSYADFVNDDTCALSLQAHWDYITDDDHFYSRMIATGQLEARWFNRLDAGWEISHIASEAKKRNIKWSAYLHHAKGFAADSFGVDIDGDNVADAYAPRRDNSPSEMWCSTGLNLSFGATGIIWTTYPAFVTANIDTAWRYDTTWVNDTTWVIDTIEVTWGRWNGREFLEPQFTTLSKIYASLDTVGPILQSCRWDTSFCTRSYEENFDFPYISNGDTLIDMVYTKWNNTPYLTWSVEAADSTFIQVGVFEAPNGSSDERYLFLVNRRCEPTEERRVYVTLDMPQASTEYRCELARKDTNWVVTTDANGKMEFMVQLPPGEFELFHIMQNTDLIITGNETIYAPYQLNRNIRIRNGGSLTILPDTTLGEGDTAVVTCWKRKGIYLDQGSNNDLNILGSDSVAIKFRALDGMHDESYRWAGISAQRSANDTIQLRNVVLEDAMVGLFVNAARSLTKSNNTHFRYCRIGIVPIGYTTFSLDSSEVSQCGLGILAYNGASIHATDSKFNENWSGMKLMNGVTIRLEKVEVNRNQYGGSFGKRGILAYNSDLMLKCTTVNENSGDGLEMVGGSLLIADIDYEDSLVYLPRFGANYFINNDKSELYMDGPATVWVKNGENWIFDEDAGITENFVTYLVDSTDNFATDWSGNYWGGLDSNAEIGEHFRALPSYSNPGLVLFEPAIVDSPEFCDFTTETPGVDHCIDQALGEELSFDLSNASISYQDFISSSTANCQKRPAINRYLSVNTFSHVDSTTTISYLTSVLDTATDAETRHVLKLGIALMLAEGLANTNSAKIMYQQVIDSAGGDIYRKIDGQAGKLLVEMREEESDTVDGLTVEELTAYLDSLDQILGQRFVWTQYEITDSVVMYAPTRVDSVINVRGDGVLTILPHPGYKNPVIEFVNQGAIKVYGTDTTKVKGKLYVYGEPESRITLHWEDSTGTKNVYSERGFVKMKHADFYGNGFVNQSQDVSGYLFGQRRATFQADSCTFSWFDEGVMVKATDTTSYMRVCTLSNMGAGGFYYTGFGAGLIMMKSDGFTVEDCIFEGNGGAGIYHGYANDVIIRNCTIANGAKMGIYGASASGGSARLECCTVESNGDTLPELLTLGVVYDLVGGHNSFADSTGPLIKSTDPSYVDIENGENFFELWDEGYYVQSGDTNDSWDITWNTWSPSMPGDGDFYNYFWPHTSSKWTVDSSLTDFVSCGESATSSLGGGSWLVVGADEQTSGTMSTGDSDPSNDALDLSQEQTSKQAHGKALGKTPTKQTFNSLVSKSTLVRKQAKADLVAAHHRELSQWRALRDGKAVNVKQAAMQFVNENRRSEFVPAVLSLIAGKADARDIGYTSSKYLRDFASETKDKSLRVLAERLAYHAMALEGRPGDALTGLEEMMDEATSPRDSVLALLDAMQVYCDYHHTGDLRAKHGQVMVTDPYDLVRRSLYLAERLDDPELGIDSKDALIPTSYALYQNYPNPFNPSTDIRFDLPEGVRVELKIFNILGQEVVTLVDDVRAAGAYRVLWDGKNAAGLNTASGVYVYQIKTPNFHDAKKMVMIK